MRSTSFAVITALLIGAAGLSHMGAQTAEKPSIAGGGSVPSLVEIRWCNELLNG